LPSAKRARTQEADPAAPEVGLLAAGGVDQLVGAPMLFEVAGKPKRATARRSSSGRRPSGAKPRAAPPRGFGAAVGVFVVGGKAADVSDLARRLGDLKSRLSPIAAQAHERVAAQLRTLLPQDARRAFTPSPGSWAAQERLRLLAQLEALERLPRLAVAVKRHSSAAAHPLPEPLAAALRVSPPLPQLGDAELAGPGGAEQHLQDEAADGNATEESDG